MAGRIPQHFIDQLINRIDIVDLIDDYVPLKKAGANYKACCPFHNEKTPSFTVSPSKQFYHCFGCGANGTAISWLMDYDHMEFREAIEKLASSTGLKIPEESQGYEKKKTVSQGIDLYDLMTKISAFYQTQLRQHADKQQAIDYLKNRGLSGEIAKRFGLGFAPEGWDNLMSAHGTTDASKKALVDTGMLSQNDNDRIYDRFRHRIMFPIHDHRGRVVGFGGRVLDQGEPKYLNSPETPIFHKGSELYGLYAARGGIKDADGVLVVEGYMDVVALAQADINNAVATLGTATTPMHIQRLFRHTQNITFSFDGDRAGRAAAWKALETCLPMVEDGHQISFLFLPDGEDPDSMVAKVGKTQFKNLIDEATPLPDFLIDTLAQQADINRLDGRAKLAKLAQPLIQKMRDSMLKNLVVDRLAKHTQISAQDIAGKKQESTSRQQRPRSSKQASTSKNGVSMTPTRRALSLLLQYPALAQEFSSLKTIPEDEIRGLSIIHSMLQICAEVEHCSTSLLLERFRTESYFDTLSNLANHQHNNMESLSDDEALELIRSTNSKIMAEYNELRLSKATAELESLNSRSTASTLSPQEQDRKQQLVQFLKEQYKA